MHPNVIDRAGWCPIYPTLQRDHKITVWLKITITVNAMSRRDGRAGSDDYAAAQPRSVRGIGGLNPNRNDGVSLRHIKVEERGITRATHDAGARASKDQRFVRLAARRERQGQRQSKKCVGLSHIENNVRRRRRFHPDAAAASFR
jgi:hypothetical protein